MTKRDLGLRVLSAMRALLVFSIAVSVSLAVMPFADAQGPADDDTPTEAERAEAPDVVGGPLFSSPLVALPSIPNLGALPTAELDQAISGAELVSATSTVVDAVAAANGFTGTELVRLASDPSVNFDQSGRLYYVDPFDELAALAAAPEPAFAPVFPNSQTFRLHSRPGSKRVIYLDFNGHEVGPGESAWMSGASWSVGSFHDGSQASHDTIQEIWARVAEDFAPFDVDVTTENPGLSAIQRTSASDDEYGTRVLFTPSDSSAYGFCGSCAGIAYNNVFSVYGQRSDGGSWHDYYQPAIVHRSWAPRLMADTASHEAGHNLALGHDGDALGAYHLGDGLWRPIMGTGLNAVAQWSSGQYANANNTENDLAVIAASGAPFRADDHGDVISTATPLSGGFATGIIGDPGDVDVFRIHVSCPREVAVTADPALFGPNLDIALWIFDSAGSLIGSNNPGVSGSFWPGPSGLNAAWQGLLSEGTNYFAVRGSASAHYTRYGSLGQFEISSTNVGGCVASCGGIPATIEMVSPFQTGTSGNDVIVGTPGNDTIFGGGGNDVICGGGGSDTIHGGLGKDTIYGEGGTDRIFGGPGGDLLVGGSQRDVIYGQGGPDVIHGNAGRDSLYGGDENDEIDGGPDTDMLRGQNGNDELRSGVSGNDRLVGGDGNDILDARRTSGSTRQLGESGIDTMYGSPQVDRFWGGDGRDVIRAGAGNDLIRAGAGDDTAYGDDGNDSLDGDVGNDTLVGGNGNDLMVGMAGADVCTGGSGNDRAHSTCETIR